MRKPRISDRFGCGGPVYTKVGRWFLVVAMASILAPAGGTAEDPIPGPYEPFPYEPDEDDRIRGLPPDLVTATKKLKNAWDSPPNEAAETLAELAAGREEELNEARASVAIMERWFEANPDDPLRPVVAVQIMQVYRTGVQLGMPGKEASEGEEVWRQKSKEEVGDRIFVGYNLASGPEEYIDRVAKLRRFLDTGDVDMIVPARRLTRHVKKIGNEWEYSGNIPRFSNRDELIKHREKLRKRVAGELVGAKSQIIGLYGGQRSVMAEVLEELGTETDLCRLARFVIAEQYLGRLEGFAE